MTANFADILAKPAGHSKEPVPLPTGHYTFMIKSFDFGTSRLKQTPFVEFLCSPTAPGDDVDAELLEACENWNEKEMKYTFYFTPAATFMIDQFLHDTLGITIEDVPYGECIGESVNMSFLGTVEHSAPQAGSNRTQPFANIRGHAAL